MRRLSLGVIIVDMDVESPSLLRRAERIPDDLPFVLRPGRIGRWTLIAAGPALSAFMIGLFVIGLLAGGEPVDDDPAGLAWVIGLALLLGLVVGVPCWWAANRIYLAADEDGVWVTVRHWPALAVRLPWESVARIEYAGGHGGQLHVIPTDPAVASAGALLRTGNDGSGSQRRWRRWSWGGRLVAKVPASVSVPGVLEALAGFADRSVPLPYDAAPASDEGPRPYQRIDRVPADLPLVLRIDRRSHLAATLVTGAVTCLVALGLFGLIMYVYDQPYGWAVVGLVGLMAIGVSAVYVAPAVANVPLLAADRNGMWICYKPYPAGTRTSAIWLPWQAIERVGVDGGTVHVKPYGDRAPGRHVVATAEQPLLDAAFGHGIQVRVGLDDSTSPGSDTAVRAALAVLADGRTPIGL